mmetsp:Transcript_66492/g.156948  ORF Transcript_66492/g.156948 Transcript_66492/m.156948 type:complete len:84 (+) Transcript_66492:110-361(+)
MIVTSLRRQEPSVCPYGHVESITIAGIVDYYGKHGITRPKVNMEPPRFEPNAHHRAARTLCSVNPDREHHGGPSRTERPQVLG